MKAKIFCILALGASSFSASAETNNVYGKITSLTTNSDGLMIRVEGNIVPTNCVDAPFGWMFIPNSAGAMAATVLSIWLRGNAYATVYTLPTTNTYCAVTQIDPTEP